MAIDIPTWLQNGSYSARLDRIFSDILFTEGVMRPGTGQFAVSPSSPAAMTVQVAAGYACIEGDDQADQGKYLVRSTATETVTITAAPGSGSRIDLVCLRINDPDAGGPAGNNATLVVVAGTPAGSPVPPALPTSAIALAQVTVASGTTAITAGMIADARTQAQTILANTLTNAGDLLSFDGANSIRVAAGPIGQPLVSAGTSVGYSQLSAAGIATDAVQTAKIQDLAVTTPKIANLAVTTAKIADGSITAAKLAAGISTRVGCELTYTSSLSYSGSGLATIPSWTEVVDTSTFYASGATASIPVGLDGLYLINLVYDSGSIATSTDGQILINSIPIRGDSTSLQLSSNTVMKTMSAGETIGARMFVNSGATFTVSNYNIRLIVNRLG